MTTYERLRIQLVEYAVADWKCISKPNCLIRSAGYGNRNVSRGAHVTRAYTGNPNAIVALTFIGSWQESRDGILTNRNVSSIDASRDTVTQVILPLLLRSFLFRLPEQPL